MKIKLNRQDCVNFLYEIVDEFGESSTYYGMSLQTEDEEKASKDYEASWRKLQTALNFVFKEKAKTDV